MSKFQEQIDQLVDDIEAEVRSFADGLPDFSEGSSCSISQAVSVLNEAESIDTEQLSDDLVQCVRAFAMEVAKDEVPEAGGIRQMKLAFVADPKDSHRVVFTGYDPETKAALTEMSLTRLEAARLAKSILELALSE